MTDAITITCYHSLKDPIIEGLLLRYLNEINSDHVKYQFVLITFEQSQYALSEPEQASTIEELRATGIIWKPLIYRTGGPLMLLKKLINFLDVWWYVFKLKRQFQIKGIMGFTSISGSMAAVLGKVFRKPIIVYCFEPHSEYQIDFGTWSERSVNYKILKGLEKYQVKHASHIVVPTQYGVDLVTSWGTNAKIYTMPVSVDEHLFNIDNQARDALRSELNIRDKKLILYLGKFDGIYFSVETVASFYKALLHESKEYHFLTITTSPVDEVNQAFFAKGLQKSDFTTIPPVPYSEVNRYINAADLGMLAVPSLPSQKYRTPIKTANYLLCGLPYLVNPGVAEDDLVANSKGVGVVTNIEQTGSAIYIHHQLKQLLSQPNIRDHCRSVGLDLRKLSNTTSILEEIFKSVILAK